MHTQKDKNDNGFVRERKRSKGRGEDGIEWWSWKWYTYL